MLLQQEVLIETQTLGIFKLDLLFQGCCKKIALFERWKAVITETINTRKTSEFPNWPSASLPQYYINTTLHELNII